MPAGVLLATAAGDALGAGYEFGPPLPDDAPVTMRGGGAFNWAPGEWTDDTAMAIAIAEVAATGADLRGVDAQDQIVARWVGWSRTAPDVGNQTSQVLGRVLGGGVSGAAAAALAASADLHERTGRTAGNGSLMRTAPVALAYLDDPHGLAEAAMAVSALTHFDRSAGEACVLWCLAIRHAVLTGELDPRVGLEYVPAEQRGRLGRAAGRRRETAAERLQQQRLGRRGAAGRVVRDRPHAMFGSRPGPEGGRLAYRSPADVARDRGARRPRRGHGGRDRRRPRRRGLRRVRRSSGLAVSGPRLARATTPPTSSGSASEIAACG